ncbi:hypothetical protein [Alkalicoccobacillus murimartini]|uniref:Membrane protein YccC n=1 Tax=Alkalicoccobacillus murimartini TaxID=171685 RepID=A0ABT9YMB7_9BACI|nr:hypothetical protein [Alkalicoccobacillus murimartini]MDQ0208886.1 putative membrane protein YccC [Alkalicoccobacillus murimartini]
MFGDVDNSIFTEMAIRLGILFFGSLIAGIVVGLILKWLRMPIWIVQPVACLTILFVMYQMFMLGIADI